MSDFYNKRYTYTLCTVCIECSKTLIHKRSMYFMYDVIVSQISSCMCTITGIHKDVVNYSK